jgi:periplasmic divalent cation tolerance protein
VDRLFWCAPWLFDREWIMSWSPEAIMAELERDTPDFDVLVEALEDDDVKVRAVAADVLGKVFGYVETPPAEKRPAALEALLARWDREKSNDVRSTLAQTLALLGDPSVRPVLEAALDDGDPRVRRQASWGLEYLSLPARDRPKPGRPEPRERVVKECVRVLTMLGSEEDAVRLGRSVLDARLAAGVQIAGPVRSMSWYEGDFGDAPQWQLDITTTAERFPELEQHIKDNHPYGTPDIITTPIAGNADYLAWVSSETGQAGDP